MIVLVLAAALSYSDVIQELAHIPSLVNEYEALIPRAIRTGYPQRHYCRLAAAANDASFEYRKLSARGYLALGDKAIIEKNNGAPTYNLTEDDKRFLATRQVDMEQKSARYDALCRAR